MKKNKKIIVSVCILAILLCVSILYVFNKNLVNKKSYARQIDQIYTGMENEIFDETMSGLSSNPYDYTVNNKYYDQIVSLGVKALPDLEYYLIKEGDGLSGYLTALAIQDILNCNIYNLTKNNWTTGSEFYTGYMVCKADLEKNINNVICCGDSVDDKIQELEKYGKLAIPYINKHIEQQSSSQSDEISTGSSKDLKELSDYVDDLDLSEEDETFLSKYLNVME